MRQLAKGSPDVMRSARSLTDNSSETLYTDVIPAFSIRFGNLSRFFMDYKFNNQFTPAFPVLAHQIAIGFPLDKNGSLVRIGSGSYAGLFIAPSVRIGKNFIVEPTVGFGKGFGSYNSSDSFIGSINLHYKFNRKEKSMK